MRMAYTVPETPSEGWRERNASYYMHHWERLQEELMEERYQYKDKTWSS